jgi:hypothetical protein
VWDERKDVVGWNGEERVVERVGRHRGGILGDSSLGFSQYCSIGCLRTKRKQLIWYYIEEGCVIDKTRIDLGVVDVAIKPYGLRVR